MPKHIKQTLIPAFFAPKRDEPYHAPTLKSRTGTPSPTRSELAEELGSQSTATDSHSTPKPLPQIELASNPPIPSEDNMEMDPQVKDASARYEEAATTGFIPRSESSDDANIFAYYSGTRF